MVLRTLLFAILAPALLALAGLVTVARLVQPQGDLWVRLVAVTPFAIVPYALVALLVLVPALRGRRGAGVLLVVALVGLGLHAWWLAPLYTGARPSVSAEAERLTVMTANVESSGATAPDVATAVSDGSVDMLALVEVSSETLASLDAQGLAAQLPYRVGEDDPRGLVLLSRVPLEPGSTQEDDDGGLVVNAKVGAKDLRVIVVHPTQPISSLARWRREHRAIRAQLRQPADLVLGDFNATLDHAPMQDLLDAGLRDVTELANQGWQPTWPTEGVWYLPRPVAQLDHVLVGRHLTGLSSRTVTIDGTDHRAVLAEVALR